MTKDEQGVWSITVGPLTPDYLQLHVHVDGVRTVDPKNAMVKPGLSSLDSMFLVPGDEAEFELTRTCRTARSAPPGIAPARSMRRGACTSTRRPATRGAREKYPVLYLLHGAGDEDSGWSTIGRAGFILDNLMAEKKAVPMIVVMPNGSLPRPANMPRLAPGTPPSPEVEGRDGRPSRTGSPTSCSRRSFRSSRRHYRVKTGRENRAIAGLSMGGGQTLRVVTTHPDEFAYVGIWSAGLFGGNAEEFEKRNEAFFKRRRQVNKAVKLLSISVGDKDFALNGSKSLAGAAREARNQARAAHQRRRPHLDQLAALSERAGAAIIPMKDGEPMLDEPEHIAENPIASPLGQVEVLAARDLLPLVYAELRRLAALRLRGSVLAKRSNQLRLCMKHICVSQARMSTSPGMTAATSSPPRPRP